MCACVCVFCCRLTPEITSLRSPQAAEMTHCALHHPLETSAACFQPQTVGMAKSALADFSEEQKSLLGERFRTTVAHPLARLPLCRSVNPTQVSPRCFFFFVFVALERKDAADHRWFESCCPGEARPSDEAPVSGFSPLAEVRWHTLSGSVIC